jgi:hypothetical protein
MPGGERRRLVEKEQLGPRVGLHYRTPPPVKGGATGDPAADLPGPHNALGVVVQDASIAHQQATLRKGDDLAIGRDPILQWHGVHLV